MHQGCHNSRLFAGVSQAVLSALGCSSASTPATSSSTRYDDETPTRKLRLLHTKRPRLNRFSPVPTGGGKGNVHGTDEAQSQTSCHLVKRRTGSGGPLVAPSTTSHHVCRRGGRGHRSLVACEDDRRDFSIRRSLRSRSCFTHEKIHVATADANSPPEDTYSLRRMRLANADSIGASFPDAPARRGLKDIFSSSAGSTSSSSSSSSSTGSLDSGTSHEDCLSFISVFDGHGGPQVAHFAAERMGEMLEQKLKHKGVRLGPAARTGRTSSVDELAAHLRDAYREVDAMCWEMCSPCCDLGFSNVARVGSCAVSAVLTESAVVVANVGDCRCMVGRSRTNSNTKEDAGATVRFVPSAMVQHSEYNKLMQSLPRKWMTSAGGSVEGTMLTTLHNANDPMAREIMRRDFPDDPDVVQCIQGWQDTVTGQVSRLRPLMATGGGLGGGSNLLMQVGETSDQPPGEEEEAPTAAFRTGSLSAQSQQHKALSSPGRWQPAEFGCYVKGCLQPTRSMGDFYLKKATAAVDPVSGLPLFHNQKHLPYISSEPDVRVYEGLTARDKFLVLASDGLWDFLTEEEVLDALEPYFFEGDEREPQEIDVNLAQVLLDRVLDRVAREHSLSSVATLRTVPAASRRKMFDDTTIVVVVL